ncbi:hypothetical protein Goari_001089, partial [Gossypium aridum]|nr:hypothetical protein [Gossypium aridum]
MTRKKVKLAYITNDSTRKDTYKKRMKALKNKMSKLSTRCGSDTCVIMYSPYKSQLELEIPEEHQLVETKAKGRSRSRRCGKR